MTCAPIAELFISAVSQASRTLLKTQWKGGLAALLVVAAVGCAPEGHAGIGAVSHSRGGGGAKPLPEVVAAINSNAARLNQALWSSNIDADTRFHDESGKQHSFDLDGTLLYRPPMSLRLDLSHGLGEKVMQVGSNPEEYWVWIAPEVRRMWWGHHRNAGRDCTRRLVVQPHELICALGLSGLPSQADGLTGPRRIKGKRHDILQYFRPVDGGELRLVREYRVDYAAPHHVRLVAFYDEGGKIEVSAYLDEYRQTWNNGPLVPHNINVVSHRTKDEFTLSMKGATPMPDNKIAAGAFERPTDRLPAEIRSNIVQIDADCGNPR